MADNKGVWQAVTTRFQKSKRVYHRPEDLWRDALEYFRWVQANPLEEEQLVSAGRGQRPHREIVKRPRAMTITALCAFLNVRHRTWHNWRTDEILEEVVERIEAVIYSQKFEYAAVDMMNASLIARDLKLADRSEVSGPDGAPISQQIDLSTLTDEELEAYRVIVAAAERNRT